MILSFIVLTLFITIGTYFYILKKQEDLLNSIYKTTHLNIVNTSEQLIQDKLNTALAIALALAKDANLYKFIQNKDFEKLDYKRISEEIKENSKYKNVWIQIIDHTGKSIYRSWSDKKGDNLLFRNDLKNTLENQDISTSISVGIFNLTLKARTPIYDDNQNFLGALEVITHFNSISKDLSENNINTMIITDKKFSKFLKYPHSNVFIDGYNIVNEDSNLYLINHLKKNNIEKYINIKDYIVEDGYLISNHVILDGNNEKIAYILNFLKLENIDLQSVKSFKIQIVMVSIIALIIIFFNFLLYIYSKYLTELKLQENKKQAILDSQSNIIVITNGYELIDANKKLLELFPSIKNIKEFKDKHRCVCKKFIDMKNDIYIIDNDYNGKNWAEYVLENKIENFRVAIKNENDEIRHFSLKASKLSSNKHIIATFTDITQEILKIENDKQKDRLLFQQSKIAAIADTVKNIAHQWRQPLSTISTIASGMKIQKEMDILSNEEFYNSCNVIIKNTQKLSNTIENFTNFFDKNDTISSFSIVEATNEVLNFFNSIFENNNIIYSFNYDKDIVLKCSKNDFSQSILNILDNAIYALVKNKDENDRFIFIDFSNNILQIKDSADGINEAILSKILEPYFTTKHQAFGVGLGLYVVQEFFVKTLGYKIEVKNVTFEHNNKKYLGTNFIIDFN